MYKDYTISVRKQETGENSWNTNNVTILKANKEILSFERNYPNFTEETICFFERDNIDYMLFSEKYIDISILNLQERKSEQLKLYKKEGREGASGFCPINIYVPKTTDEIIDNYTNSRQNIYFPFALVQGCIWGNDFDNYDLRILDLRNLTDIKYLKGEYHLSCSRRLDIRKDLIINIYDNSFRVNIPVDKFIDIESSIPEEKNKK